MKTRLTVFLDTGLNVVRWLACPLNEKNASTTARLQSPVAQGESASWADLAARQPEQLVVVLPASLVYHSQTEIPSHDPRVIQQSIHWAVEEELATPVEDNHVAWRPANEERSAQAVAVVADEIMQNLLRQLAACSLQPDVITSELYCLPLGETGAVAEIGQAANESVHPDTAVFARTTAGEPGVIVRQNRWQGGFVPAAAWVETVSQKFEKSRQVDIEPQQALGQGVNFLQGAYAPRHEQAQNRRQWRWLALAVMALLLSVLLVNGLKYWQLRQQEAQLKNLQLQTLREAFVDATAAELADPVNAMRSRIKGLRQASGQGSGALTAILAALASTREQVPAVRIQGLHWRDNALELQLVAPGIDAINRFQQLLKGQNIHWQINTGTREAISDGIKSVLVIKVLS